jgi:hypothetical protein
MAYPRQDHHTARSEHLLGRGERGPELTVFVLNLSRGTLGRVGSPPELGGGEETGVALWGGGGGWAPGWVGGGG